MSIEVFIENFNKKFEKKYPNKGFFICNQLLVSDTKFPVYKTCIVNIYHYPSRDIAYTYSLKDKFPNNSTSLKPKYKNQVIKELKEKSLEIMEKYGSKC